MKTTDDGRQWPVTAAEWRQVPGFEDSYEVSPDGRIRSLDRTVTTRAGDRTYRGHELVVVRGRVTLSHAGEATSVRVARVVAEVFGGAR